MTDEPKPDLDELLSADLDGEATVEERARLGDAPGARSRRGELQAAADVAGVAPTPLGPEAVDALIGSTLDRTLGSAPTPPSPAEPRSRAGGPGDAGDAPVPDAGPTPPARAWRGPPPVLVAAAVLVLLVAGLALVFTDRPSSRSDDRSAASNTDAEAPEEGTAGAGADGDAAGRRPVVDDLGDFVDPAALRTAFRDRIPGPSTTPVRPAVAFTAAQVDRCKSAVEARNPGLAPEARQRTAAATIAGSPVLVVEYSTSSVRTGAPTTRVVAVGIFACDDRVNFER